MFNKQEREMIRRVMEAAELEILGELNETEEDSKEQEYYQAAARVADSILAKLNNA